MAFDLTEYKAMAFDIYATLIDWETGLWAQLKPLYERLPASSPIRKPTEAEAKDFILRRYGANEMSIEQAQPTLLYTKILQEIYRRLATELSVPFTSEEAITFSNGIGTWAPYPDTVRAMNTLGKYYKLIALSNVDKASFENTCTGPLRDVTWDGKYLAEDIGSYKPDFKNFYYLMEHAKGDFGVEKEEILLVAQGLQHDHVPWMELRMKPSVWISRYGRKGAMGGKLEEYESTTNLGAVYTTLGELADAVEKAHSKLLN